MENEKKDQNKTEEKIEEKELTDEQANDAAGGLGQYYTCSGCRRQFFGSPFRSGGKAYCANCVPKTIIL